MISGFTLMPAFCTSAAASNTARACISEISGYTMPKTATAEAEHRVELVQFVHALRDLLDGHAHLLREIVLRGVVVRQEFVQRRIEETDRRREAFQFLEDADEVFALIRQEFGERFFAVFDVVRENHFAHRVDAIAFEEHVFRAAEADAGGAERNGVGGLFRRVGVGADLQPRDLRAPVHQLLEDLVRSGCPWRRAIFRRAPGRFPKRPS